MSRGKTSSTIERILKSGLEITISLNRKDEVELFEATTHKNGVITCGKAIDVVGAIRNLADALVKYGCGND